jgi:hypothetical protein
MDKVLARDRLVILAALAAVVALVAGGFGEST